MKVLHLISGGDSGGAKTHLFSLLGKLKDIADVRIGCLTEGVFYRELPEVGVDYCLFRQKSRFDLSVVDDIAEMIKKEGFEVLHVHGARANFVGVFVRKRVDIPVITTVHSDYLLDFDDPFKKLVFTSLNKYALKKIPYFIAVSDNFREMLTDRGFRPNSIYTVYNGMDFSKVPERVTSKEDFCRERGFEYDGSKVYVGIAARFDSVKGVDIFIKAAGEVLKKRSNIEFLIAGDGAEKDSLVSLAKDLGAEDRIRFLGFERDIYAFYNVIDINTLTSLSESFPYSMLEGAAMGKPMAASDVGGISSLVINGETGFLFESGDYRMLAEKIILLADDAELRKKLGDGIRKRAVTYFSADRFAADHIKIYSSIIKDHKSAKKYDFIISGYYGFGNNGDDALLLSICENIKKQLPDARLVIMSNDPQKTQKLYGVDSVSRIDPFKFIPAMRSSSVLLSGGGSLLQDATSSKSLYYYLSVIKLAKRSGLSVMQIANGFGPIEKKRNITLTRKTINSCVDRITVRDRDSFEFIRSSVGVDVPMSLTADPAMLLNGSDGERVLQIIKTAEEEANDIQSSNIVGGKYVTVSLREWKNSAPDLEDSVAATLCRLRDEYGLYAVFVPMQNPNDIGISLRIAEKMKKGAVVLKSPLGINDIIGIIRDAELNIAMRLHAMIYSVAACTPTVAVRYDPKVDGFMKYAGLDNIVDAEFLTEDSLYDAAVCGMKSLPDEKRRDELKSLAIENISDAICVLEKAKIKEKHSRKK